MVGGRFANVLFCCWKIRHSALCTSRRWTWKADLVLTMNIISWIVKATLAKRVFDLFARPGYRTDIDTLYSGYCFACPSGLAWASIS